MAGIGFELKKLFNRRGLFAAFRAYGYAGVVCTGPMLLGVVLLLGVMFLCDITGGSRHSRELLVCMITYTLLASLTVTSFLSMVVTRFIADQLGLSMEEVAAFGDADNDADMLKEAGVGIAVGNASVLAMEAADMVVPHHDRDGVAAGIYQLLGK